MCCVEGGALQTSITGVCGECLQSLGHTVFAPAHGVCAFMVYTAQTLGCSAGNCLRQALGCVHFPGLSRSGPGSRVLHNGETWLGLRFVPSPGQSTRVTRCLASAVAPRWACDLSPPPAQPLGVLGVQRAPILRCAVCLFRGADLWL